jgi:hypothetical protein
MLRMSVQIQRDPGPFYEVLLKDRNCLFRLCRALRGTIRSVTPNLMRIAVGRVNVISWSKIRDSMDMV